jgi:hypothetical protein
VAQLGALSCLLSFTAQLVRDIIEGEQRLQPGPLVLGLGLGVLLPLALVAVLRRGARATAEVDGAHLRLTLRGGASMEIPYDAVEAVRPWRLPLPGPGLALHMKTGRRFGHGLEVEDAVPLLEALGRRGPLGAAQAHPLVRYAQARHAFWRRRWYALGFKLVLFPLVPTVILFRAHQYIAFGGPFGEYQMLGLGAYLRSFANHFVPVTLSFMLCACFFRVLAEAASFAAAWVTPSLARGVRRGAEWLCRLVYYVGLPGIIIARFFL